MAILPVMRRADWRRKGCERITPSPAAPASRERGNAMKSTILFLGLALLSTIAVAGESEQLQLIADRAGVSVNDVRMVLGNRTSFAQYRSSFDRKEARVMRAVAELATVKREERERHEALVAKQDR